MPIFGPIEQTLLMYSFPVVSKKNNKLLPPFFFFLQSGQEQRASRAREGGGELVNVHLGEFFVCGGRGFVGGRRGLLVSVHWAVCARSLLFR